MWSVVHKNVIMMLIEDQISVLGIIDIVCYCSVLPSAKMKFIYILTCE